MIVYGDPKYRSSLSRLRRELCDRGFRASGEDLDELRDLLIQAGQFEQGVFDWLQESGRREAHLSRSTREVTEATAEIFFTVWARVSGSGWSSSLTSDPRRISSALSRLSALALDTDPVLTIKVPEGFAFYALYPEQYCCAALKWAQDHTGTVQRRVLVVGIRSIGTTLSALVKAALQGRGWFAERFTVRPRGHPFARKVELTQPVSARETPEALVVDEGPGLSGSSMAAVAEALSASGIQHISFMPGHGGEPGTAASPGIRQWWNRAPRYTVGQQELRWNGRSLVETLERTVAEASFKSDRSLLTSTPTIQDVSAGMWRRWAYPSAADWPAVCGSFERMKFLCRSRDGDDYLWKFEGLGTSTRPKPGQRGSFGGPARTLGFVATRWVEGRRLRQRDAGNQEILDCLADHITQKAGPPLAGQEAKQASERLAQMAYWNTKESFGDTVADEVWRIQQAAELEATAPSYGDGRMGPWEWVEKACGGLVKTDDAGHDQDHTVVARQPVAWDVAGAMVEWGLDAAGKKGLLDALGRNELTFRTETLRFYELAYAAFRLGMVSLAASQGLADTSEMARLQQAHGFYASKLLATVKLHRCSVADQLSIMRVDNEAGAICKRSKKSKGMPR